MSEINFQLYFLTYLIFYRFMIFFIGILSIVLGYRLFINGFCMPGNSDSGSGVSAKVGGAELSLQNAAPGTCFALFGVIVISIMISKGNPELILENEKFQEIKRQEKVISQTEEIKQVIPVKKRLTMRGDKDDTSDSFSTLFDNAIEHEENGEIQEAIKGYQKAVKRAGKAMNALAWLYLTEMDNKIDDAMALSLIAVKYDPEEPNYKDTLAEVLYQKENYCEAFKLKEKAASLDRRYQKDINRFQKACKAKRND